MSLEEAAEIKNLEEVPKKSVRVTGGGGDAAIK
jgi:hypothetical protein